MGVHRVLIVKGRLGKRAEVGFRAIGPGTWQILPQYPGSMTAGTASVERDRAKSRPYGLDKAAGLG